MSHLYQLRSITLRIILPYQQDTTMSDKKPILRSSHIFIDNIRLHAYHGVLPQEHQTGNDYVVSISAGYDISRAMQTDDVADTLNYASILDAVREEMSVPARLIEHVAARIADHLFSQFPDITSLKLRIRKCNPPMGSACDGAGVEIYITNEKTK